MGTEDAIIYNSGFLTNVATIGSLVRPGDLILADELVHACLVDGAQFSGAELRYFPHQDYSALERMLVEAVPREVLVLADGIYSMEGDVVDLPQLAGLCQQHGATLMLDEAHSFGVLGATGQGVVEHFGMRPEAVGVRMGTLSKALGGQGGFVAGSGHLVDYLRHHSRGYIFSVALHPLVTAVALEGLKVLREEPQRLEQLRQNSNYWREGLAAAGYSLTQSASPIVPVLFESESETLAATQKLLEAGLFVVPIFYPAVPLDAPRIRTSVTAGHTREQLDMALKCFRCVRP